MRRPHVSRAELGEGNLLNLAWLSLLLVAVYFGIMFIPVYSEQFTVKSMLQDVGNSNWRNYDEDKVRQALIARCKEYNKPDKEYFLLDPENVVVENNETTKKLTLRITWTRVVPYPFLQRQTRRVFTQQYQVDTNPVKYD